MRRTRVLTAMSIAAIVVAVLLSGCASPTIVYVEDGGVKERPDLESLLKDTSPGTLAEASTNDAPRLRTAQLASLRDHSDSGREAADLITATFPGQRRAVPYHVESITFEGSPALVILEATGREDERLTRRRLWVIDDSGDVLLSLMR